MTTTAKHTPDWIEPYAKLWVLRIREHDDGLNCYPDFRTEFTENRCAEIAKLNGNMKTVEVHAALLSGKRIYSNFSYFVLE